MVLKKLSDRWITDEHRRHFASEGYMVIRSVIPTEMTAKAVGEIAAFIGADLADRATWYWGPPALDGVVPLHHAQSLWEIRQYSDLYQLLNFSGTGI